MQRQDAKGKTKGIVLTALLFASAIILASIELALPPLYPAIPGIRLGLSNIAVMYALFFTSKTNAVAIAFLKGLFAFATKGIVAGLLSFFGSILSVSIMMLLIFLFKDNISYLILSISGAVFHNIGQIIGVCIIYKGLFFLTYTPVLIIAGTVAGIVTATILRVVLPAIKQINT